jgi:hypothetical protein
MLRFGFASPHIYLFFQASDIQGEALFVVFNFWGANLHVVHKVLKVIMFSFLNLEMFPTKGYGLNRWPRLYCQ